MKTFIIIASIIAVTALSFAQVSVTVYNQNLGLIKETRQIEVKKGAFTYEASDVAAQLDPTSVHLKLDGAAIQEQNFEYDLVSRDRLLERYLNQPLEVFTEKGELFEGTLLSASGTELILQAKDGKIQVIVPAAVRDVRFSALPGGLRTEPTLVWQLYGASSGKRSAELSYLTQGMNWHAEYVAVTTEKSDQLELSSWVSIENRSGASYENAKLKLMAGDVRIISQAEPLDGRRNMYLEAMAAKGAPEFEEKPFFEYHLYTLSQPTTLKDRQTKQISLFDPATVAAKREYVFDGSKDPKSVTVNLVFRNDKSAGLGIPLPAGKMRVYQRDDDGALEFVGEDRIEHTPKDEEVRVNVGSAFDLTAERGISDTKRITDRIHEETYKVTLRNHKKETVVIKVVERLWGYWQITDTSHKYDKKNATTIEFQTTVEPDKEAVISYVVRRQ